MHSLRAEGSPSARSCRTGRAGDGGRSPVPYDSWWRVYGPAIRNRGSANRASVGIKPAAGWRMNGEISE